MAEYIENMFSVPIFHLYAADWEEKKQKLIDIASKSNFQAMKGEYCPSDYYDHKKTYWEELYPLITPEIQRFADRVERTFNVSRYWFERSGKGECHLPHNHGVCGFSAVMYIEYDENEHLPTHFIAPFNEFTEGLQQTYIPDHIKSGSVIFFPSSIHHYTVPSQSDKERLILSWNLDIPRMSIDDLLPKKEEVVEERPKIKLNYL